MLVELGLVEQRYKAVIEVLDGAASVTDVARRYGVGRQTVHAWLRRYAAEGLPGLADRSSRPSNCPHQMPSAVEARVVEMRRQHRGWGPRTILSRLARAGVSPLPSRSGIYRALVRHQLIDPKRRRRRPSDYKRWERSRAMELWQMDITPNPPTVWVARAVERETVVLGGCGSGWWRWQGATVAVRACGQEETAVGRRSQGCWRQAVERSARPSGVRSGAGSPAAGRGRR